MYNISYIFIFFLFFNLNIFSQTSNVQVITIDGAISPATADYIIYGLKIAQEKSSECLIVRLNTPGGLLKSTRVIVSGFLESPIPVVVYVSPSGAQAASAGVFVTMAANIAVMTPGTNIGAAHPVTLQGQQDSIMMEKATNDAAAFIRSISKKRNRNVKWAEDAVRKSLSLTETEALEKNVINFVAKDLNELLTKLDNEKVLTSAGEKILHTSNAQLSYIEMTFTQRLLSIISDPNIAYILFMIGIYGILFEIFNPGAIFPGVIGGISLILAFYALHTLPINYAGLALIIFAIILFILEIKIVSHGMLSVGGVISLILGSIMLIDVESALEVVKISWEIIALVVVLTTLFFLFAVTLGIKAQKRKPTTGSEGILQEIGIAITDINPEGSVSIHGEIWTAESNEEQINQGDKVIVIGINNLKLKVQRLH